jgi:HD-like signal output (HDOD) protein
MKYHTPSERVFQLRLTANEDLPIVPQLHMQAVHVSASSDGEAYQLLEVLRRDPAMSARILRIANSTQYGFSGQIASLQTAIAMLGTNEVKNLITSTAIYSNKIQLGTFDIYSYWNRSIAVAEMALAIARLLQLPYSNEIYTGALLHDIGKLVMATYFSKELSLVNEYILADGCSSYDAEMAIVGVSSSTIGSILLKEWDFPDSLADMVYYHAIPEKAKTAIVESHIIEFAVSVSKMQDSLSHDEVLENDEIQQKWNNITKLVPDVELDYKYMISTLFDVVNCAGKYVYSILNN